MLVELQLKQTSQPIVYDNVVSTYTKGGLFCVLLSNPKKVHKYPIKNIWRIVEDYGYSPPKSEPTVGFMEGFEHHLHEGFETLGGEDAEQNPT